MPYLSVSLSVMDVRRTFQRINPRKASGPNNIPGQVWREFAQGHTGVFAEICNTSLSQTVVPACFKRSTIIPMSKSLAAKSMNDYRPVALTLVFMKCFEQLVLAYIKDSYDISVDVQQYAYRKNRYVSDSAPAIIHSTLIHLESRTHMSYCFSWILALHLTQMSHRYLFISCC